MGGSNGYKNMVEARTSGKAKRRRLDDYETPDKETRDLLQFVKLTRPILEPACGSGRMVRVLRKETGLAVTGFDIKKGNNFLERTKPWDGDIVTNPPYHQGMAERFARQSLKLASGRVCLLLQSGFLWGGRRAKGLFADYRPDNIVILPERVYFLVNGEPIPAQFFTHAWVCWPARKIRERGGYPTLTHWAEPDDLSSF